MNAVDIGGSHHTSDRDALREERALRRRYLVHSNEATAS